MQNTFFILGGSKVIYSFGTVQPEKSGFHTNQYILPAGFKSSAILPSFVQEGARIEYFQEIVDVGEASPLFRITPSDATGEAVEDRVSCSGAWAQMLKKIAARAPEGGRSENEPPPDGFGLFGLREPEVRHRIEQLPGAAQCAGYEGDAAGVNLASGEALRPVSDPQEFLRTIRQMTSADPSVPVTELPADATHPMLHLLTGAAAPGPVAPGPVAMPQLPLAVSQTVTLHSLGQVVFDRPNFHNSNSIFPAGFKSTKKFFSSVSSNGVCEYVNEIIDNGTENPIFRVTASDNPTLSVDAASPSGVWKIIRDRINTARPDRQKSKTCFVNGPQYFGLSHPTVMRLIEQLPNADKCTRYQGAKRAAAGKRTKRAREGEEGEEESAPTMAPSQPAVAAAPVAPAAAAPVAAAGPAAAAAGVPTPQQMMMGMVGGESEEDFMLEYTITKLYETVTKKRIDAQAQAQRLSMAIAETQRLTQQLTDTNHNLEAYKTQYEHFYKLFELCLQRVLVLMSALPPERLATLPQPDQELGSLITRAADAQRAQEVQQQQQAAEFQMQQQAAAAAGQEPMTLEQQQALAAQQAQAAQQPMTVTAEQQAQFMSQLSPEQQAQFQQLPPDQQAQVILQQIAVAAQQQLTPEQQAAIIAQLPPDQQAQLQQMPPDQQASFIAAIHQQSLVVQQQAAAQQQAQQQADAQAAAQAQQQQAAAAAAQAQPVVFNFTPEHQAAMLQWIQQQGRDPQTLSPEEFAAFQNYFVAQLQQHQVAVQQAAQQQQQLPAQEAQTPEAAAAAAAAAAQQQQAAPTNTAAQQQAPAQEAQEPHEAAAPTQPPQQAPESAAMAVEAPPPAPADAPAPAQ